MAQVMYQYTYSTARWQGSISSMISFIPSTPLGMPGTSGKRTSTVWAASPSCTRALMPQPDRLSLMAESVKLSPLTRSRAASAPRSCSGPAATGRWASSAAMLSRPKVSAVVRLISRWHSSSRSSAPSSCSPTAASSPALKVPSLRSYTPRGSSSCLRWSA